MRGVLAYKVIKKSRAASASICWMQGRKGVSRAGPLGKMLSVSLLYGRKRLRRMYDVSLYCKMHIVRMRMLVYIVGGCIF